MSLSPQERKARNVLVLSYTLRAFNILLDGAMIVAIFIFKIEPLFIVLIFIKLTIAWLISAWVMAEYQKLRP